MLYAKSDAIGCMSQGNIDFIKQYNPEVLEKKLHLLPNWGDIVPLVSESEIGDLRKKENLENKFVVIFGGNIGLPQKLENIVDLAIACQDEKEILFLIMGSGNERQNLENLVASKKIKNLWLRDGLPQKEYMKWVQMADVGLISLSEKFTIPNIPSKSLSYYNTKTPILASVDSNTDFGTILEDQEVGVWSEAGHTEELKSKLLTLYNNPNLRSQMGENGYKYMQEKLSSKKAYLTIINETLEKS
jgi:glycosyltransferase involved in cell wall biosynthesis